MRHSLHLHDEPERHGRPENKLVHHKGAPPHDDNEL